MARQAPATPEQALNEVWQALADHYPMLEYAGCCGDAWLREFRPRVRAAGTLEAAFPIIEELVLRLGDYHTRLRWPGTRAAVTRAPVRLGWVEGGLAVLEAAADCGLQAGDRILAVGGHPPDEAIAAVWATTSGPTEAAHRQAACRQLSAGAPSTPLELRTEHGTVVLLHPEAVPGAAPAAADASRILELRPLDGGAAILRIRAWGGGLQPAAFTERLDTLLDAVRETPALIIDVRGNGGGLDALADACTGRFITETVVSSISFLRQPRTTTFERSVEYCQPRGPWRYGGRVAVLIDEGCCSACEHFVSGMDASGLAALVGTPTSGACGWSREIPLACGATLFCAMTFPLHGGVPSPRHGIEPHFRVPRTLADLRSGTDGPAEVALAWLRSGQGLPAARNTSATEAGL